MTSSGSWVERKKKETKRFAEKAKVAGVDVQLMVGERMVHCYPLLPPFIPEARQAMDEICTFIKSHLESKQSNCLDI